MRFISILFLSCLFTKNVEVGGNRIGFLLWTKTDWLFNINTVKLHFIDMGLNVVGILDKMPIIQELLALHSKYLNRFNYSIIWNADTHASGVYFTKMVAGDYLKAQKIKLEK